MSKTFKTHIINPNQARDFVFEHILKLIDLYTDGAITFQDLYYRIMSEPTLTIDEKHDIISSPTRETIFKLWHGEEPQYQINNIAIPVDAVVVVESKAVMWRLVNQYPWLKPIVAKPVSLGIMTALKCISSLVKGMRRPIVIPDLPWKHQDALATIVVIARLANIKLITNMPIVLAEEVKHYQSFNPRIMSLGPLDVTMIRVSIDDISTRFEPALRKFIEDYGYEGVAKTLYGIDVEKLRWRQDWWNYLDFSGKLNQEIYRKAIEYGLPSHVAKKIATWKINNVYDIVKLLREIYLAIQDQAYFRRSLNFVAEITNYRPEILETMLFASKVYEVVEDLASNNGKKIVRRKIIVDGREIYINNR